MRILSVYQGYALFGDAEETSKIGAIARGLRDRGHGVTILAADYASRTPIRRETAGGIDVILLGTVFRVRALTVNPSLISAGRTLVPSFDVAHIYGLYDLLGPGIAFFCRRSGIPYVVEPMGMLRPKHRGLRAKRLWHALLGRRLLRGAAAVVANSEQERRELLGFGIPEDRVILRRNGVAAPADLPAPGAFRRRLGLSESDRLVLFVGRITGIKSLDLLVEAFAAYRRSATDARAVLVLAGPAADEGYRARLDTLAADLGLNGSILFPGPLYGADKWAAYRDADVFVLPSQYESFGNVAAEAIVAGTPVIVTDRCGISSLVTPELGRVVPHSVEGLREALSSLLHGSTETPGPQPDQLAAARAQLSWDGPIDEQVELYESITGTPIAASCAT